ncbi:hypothetical protein H8356DRAFT_1422578 [Neocallimastix lanati (nom. inval.)]|nr:hypothetical protein H8356DRAFT_1422578 [Neocallimastix sp. JGI-2020a]
MLSKKLAKRNLAKCPTPGVRYRKSIPRKIVLENLSNNIYGCPVGTISTKCCDYLNITMS